MKFKIINKFENYEEWLETSSCDDCLSSDSETHIIISAKYSNDEINLCEGCFEKAFLKK